MHARGTSTGEILSVGDIDLEVIRRGTGLPLLLLHGMQHINPETSFLALLSQHAEIIAPSHPGFGHSECPADFDTVYDLVHLYLDVLETPPYDKVTLMGLSCGGWLAAELAVTCCHRLDRLILVDALGSKSGDRETCQGNALGIAENVYLGSVSTHTASMKRAHAVRNVLL